MKIFTSLAFSLLLLFIAVNARADDQAEARMYLAGPFNYYGMVGFSDKWELTSEDGNLYTGTFTIPADKLIFNFVEYVDEDHYTIFGSRAREGSRILFNFTDENSLFTAELEYGGQGDWAFEDWPGGEVSFEIDFNFAPPAVFVYTEIDPETGESTSGIGQTALEAPADNVIYNLQGIPVKSDNLPRGLYILNGKKLLIP